MKKVINVIIGVLVLILAFTSYKIYKNINKVDEGTKNLVQADRGVSDMYVSVDTSEIQAKLNKENSLNVLSGDITMKVTYDNQSNFDDNEEGSFFNGIWLKLTKREYTSTNKYSFMFAYDLSDLPMKVEGGDVHIYLSANRLTIAKVELLHTTVNDDTGWFASDFTPSEVNAINSRIKDIARNDIQCDSKLRNEAMLNVQDNIRELVGNDVVFELNDFDVVDNKEFNITNRGVKE